MTSPLYTTNKIVTRAIAFTQWSKGDPIPPFNFLGLSYNFCVTISTVEVTMIVLALDTVSYFKLMSANIMVFSLSYTNPGGYLP